MVVKLPVPSLAIVISALGAAKETAKMLGNRNTRQRLIQSNSNVIFLLI